MNIIDGLKNLIKNFIENEELLSIDLKKNEYDVPVITIKVSHSDMRKVIGIQGKIYRAIKTLVRSSLRNDLADVIIDVVG
jgi:predicted RNA-binding protein YlqC (UPF0109 family)